MVIVRKVVSDERVSRGLNHRNPIEKFYSYLVENVSCLPEKQAKPITIDFLVYSFKPLRKVLFGKFNRVPACTY